jgi:metallo-beta-lactamase family protein
MFGQEIPIRAQVASLEQFSDHADTPELLEWLHTFRRPPKQTYLVHGEPQAAALLREAMTKVLRWNVQVAAYRQKVQVE